MAKLSLLLALYAAALVTYVAFFRPAPGTDEGAGAADSAAEEAAWRRKVVDRARLEAREEIQPKLVELEAWRGRIETIRGEMQDHLVDLDAWIEETAQLSSGGLEDLKERLRGFEGTGVKLQEIALQIEALAKRVKALEDRPPVVREIIRTESGPAKPTGPAVPTLPQEDVEDPKVVQKKVAQAMADLASDEPAKLWAAINTTRKYEVLEAAPQLIAILQDHKNILMRRAAAQALGAVRSADAVVPLMDAMGDRDDGLGEYANTAVLEITGFDSGMEAGDRIKARRRARTAVVAWWRQHEPEVRERLGQPKG